MTDWFVAQIEDHIMQLRSALAMMEEGRLGTHHNGEDTTAQSIEQTKGWIDSLEEALARVDPGRPGD